MMKSIWAAMCIFITLNLSCASGGGVAGNDGGSEPINEIEEREYKRAISRCRKTGGYRVVKIEGTLRCF